MHHYHRQHHTGFLVCIFAGILPAGQAEQVRRGRHLPIAPGPASAASPAGVQEAPARIEWGGPNSSFDSKQGLVSEPEERAQGELDLGVAAEVARMILPWFTARRERQDVINITEPVRSNNEVAARVLMNVPSLRVINTEVVVLTGLVLAAAGVGKLMRGKRRWVVAVLVAVNAMLVPALFTKCYSYIITINTPLPQNMPSTFAGTLPPPRIVITHGADAEPGALHQSTQQLVAAMWNRGNYAGAVPLAIFAFFVPIAKILLLGLGELWRHHKRNAYIARLCIISVQTISKWASPDMFTMVLVYYLMRVEHHFPLIESLQCHEAGYTCYMLYCIFSTLATCFIPLPEVPGWLQIQRECPWILRRVGSKGLFWVVTGLLLIWAPLFFVGLGMPIMGTTLDTTVMFNSMAEEGKGTDTTLEPSKIKVFLHAMHIDLNAMFDGEVSVYGCIASCLRWFAADGELNVLLAAVVLLVFGVVVTGVSMFILWRVAFVIRSKEAASTTEAASLPPPDTQSGATCEPLQAVFLLKHLSMLDVLLVGVLLSVLASESSKKVGLTTFVGRGVPVLFAAEIVHFVTFIVVSRSVEYLNTVEGMSFMEPAETGRKLEK